MGGCRFDCIRHKRRQFNHFCSTEIILDVKVCTKFAYVVVMLTTLTHNHCRRARTRRNFFYSISRNLVQVLCTICIYLTDLAGMTEVFRFFSVAASAQFCYLNQISCIQFSINKINQRKDIA